MEPGFHSSLIISALNDYTMLVCWIQRLNDEIQIKDYRLVDSLVVKCWFRMTEVLGSYLFDHMANVETLDLLRTR